MPKSAGKRALKKYAELWYDPNTVQTVVVTPKSKIAKNNDVFKKLREDEIRNNPMVNPSDRDYKAVFGVSQKGVRKLYSKASKKLYPKREVSAKAANALAEYREARARAKANGTLAEFKAAQKKKQLQKKLEKANAPKKPKAEKKPKKAAPPKKKKKVTIAEPAQYVNAQPVADDTDDDAMDAEGPSKKRALVVTTQQNRRWGRN
jgi:cell division septum initiation protein DivIVA